MNSIGYIALVAAKHAETLNACGEESAGASFRTVRETILDEAERALGLTPEKGGVGGENCQHAVARWISNACSGWGAFATSRPRR